MCWWDERDPAKHPPLQPLITVAAGAVPLLPADQGQRTGTCGLLSWAAYPDSKALIPGDPQAGTAATDSGERLWKRSWSWSWSVTQWVMLRVRHCSTSAPSGWVFCCLLCVCGEGVGVGRPGLLCPRSRPVPDPQPAALHKNMVFAQAKPRLPAPRPPEPPEQVSIIAFVWLS